MYIRHWTIIMDYLIMPMNTSVVLVRMDMYV